MTAIDLSIVIPAYREGRWIGRCLEQLAERLSQAAHGAIEVIVVAAESPDDTVAEAVARSHRFERFRLIEAGPRQGKGRDVRLGMLAASGRYRMFMDADLATPLHHLDQVQGLIDEGGAVGIAVRPIAVTHSGTRRALSTVGNRLVQRMLLPGITDSQCGFKVFRDDVVRAVFPHQTIHGWAFDMEILALARRAGYDITQLPVNDWADPKMDGLVGESPVRASIEMFKDMLAIRRTLRSRVDDAVPLGAELSP